MRPVPRIRGRILTLRLTNCLFCRHLKIRKFLWLSGFVGHTCAGKTTFGKYAQHAGLDFVEASGVMRMIAQSKGLSDSDSFSLAKTTLEQFGPDVVARKIIQLYPNIDRGLVITGFRTIEELELLKKHMLLSHSSF